MAEDEVSTQPPPPQQPPEPSVDELDSAAASAASAAAASAAAATPTAPLLVRLLQQVRALSIRNLSAALGPDSATAGASLAPLPALPSTYIQVLVPPSQPPRPDAHAHDNDGGGGGGGDASSSSKSKSWEVLWTSEVAPETLNPSWLLLDLGAALRRLQKKGRWRSSTGAAAGGGEEGQKEEEEEGGGELEWEARVRLFALVDGGGGGGGGAVQGAGGGYGDEEQGQEAWLVPPVPGIVAGGGGGNSARQRHRGGPGVGAPSDAPSQSPPLLLAEFVLRASGLRYLPPQLPLSRLPLPADRAACLLATREGGEGLVVPGDLYDALLQLTANGAGAEGGEEAGGGGGGSRSSSRLGTPTHRRALTGPEKGAFFAAAAAAGAGGRVDEAWVAELEEDHHLGFFSTCGDDEDEEADGPAAPAPAVANGDDAVGEPTTGATAALAGVGGRREAQRLADEAARLRAAVAGAEGRLRLEEGALEAEEGVLRGEGEGVRGLMAEWEALDAELAAVGAEAARREEECRRLALLLAGRRRKLVQELQALYPILPTALPTTYTIRGLELPLDPSAPPLPPTPPISTATTNAPTSTSTTTNLRTTDDPDETTAAALGYAAHLLFLLAKYLGVPLRYALDCRASRSRIRDPAAPVLSLAVSSSSTAAALLPGAPSGSSGSGSTAGSNPAAAAATEAALQAAVTFPLYKRGVEKERFEWAVHLLRRDALQLLAGRNVPAAEVLVFEGGTKGDGGQWHVLQALQALVRHELRRFGPAS